VIPVEEADLENLVWRTEQKPALFSKKRIGDVIPGTDNHSSKKKRGKELAGEITHATLSILATGDR
jgi:hypothetical protein